MCIMMARLRPMTFSPTGMPACLRASSRQSNAARSCAKHDPERNVLGCSQTLKNDTLTHPSLWADHSFLSSDTFRNGQPSALAVDIIALMDALNIEKATLAGFDW